MKKTIVFDARMYGTKHAGIGRYILNLLNALNKIKKSALEIKLVCREDNKKEIEKNLKDNFETIVIKARHYSLNEQLELPRVLNQLKPDLVHFPHFNTSIIYQGSFVVTIHDLIKHYFKGKETTTKAPAIYWLKYLGYRFQVNYSLKKSKHIIVPTNFWKERLVKNFNVDKEKIDVTYEAVDPIFLKITNQQKTNTPLKQFGLKKPFFIHIGSVYPHKNLTTLVKAIKKIPKAQLAVICSRNVFTERVEKLTRQLNVQNQIKFLGFLPDKQVVSLYQKSSGLVFPTLMEGFGLPGLEAMAAQTPVIASNSSCLPEVYGKAAIYFDPLNVDQLVIKMKQLINDKKLRNKMITLGKKQAALYSWTKTAEQTLSVYRKVLQ